MREGFHKPKIFKFFLFLIFTLFYVAESLIEGDWSNYKDKIGENEQNLEKGEGMDLGNNSDNDEIIGDEMAENKNEKTEGNEKVELSDLNGENGIEKIKGKGKGIKNENNGVVQDGKTELLNKFPFLRNLPDESIEQFQKITRNTNLTKGELSIKRQQWAEKQNANVMNDFNQWKAKIEENKNADVKELENRLNSYTEGIQTLYKDIKAIINNNEISRKQECEQINSLLIGSKFREDFTKNFPMKLVDFCMEGIKQEEINEKNGNNNSSISSVEEIVDKPESNNKKDIWPFSKNGNLEENEKKKEGEKQNLRLNEADQKKQKENKSASSSSENVEEEVKNAIKEEVTEKLIEEDKGKNEKKNKDETEDPSSSGSASSVEAIKEKNKKAKKNKKDKNKGGEENDDKDSSSSSEEEVKKEIKKRKKNKKKIAASSSSSDEETEKKGKTEKKKLEIKEGKKKKKKTEVSSSSSDEDNEKITKKKPKKDKKVKKRKLKKEEDEEENDEEKEEVKKKHKHHHKKRNSSSSSDQEEEDLKKKKHKKHKKD